MGFKENYEKVKAKAGEEAASKIGLDGLNDPQDLICVKQIMMDIAGNKWLKAGSLLSAKGDDVAKLGYLSAMMNQNWIMIRQLDRIEKLLEKIAEK